MDELMRDRFMELVYDLLRDDDSNQRANAIINCADEYAESMKQQWIPVEERLPENWVPVLVTLKQAERLPAWMKARSYYYCVDMDVHEDSRWTVNKNNVIAWMPLPESYQEGERE